MFLGTLTSVEITFALHFKCHFHKRTKRKYLHVYLYDSLFFGSVFFVEKRLKPNNQQTNFLWLFSGSSRNATFGQGKHQTLLIVECCRDEAGCLSGSLASWPKTPSALILRTLLFLDPGPSQNGNQTEFNPTAKKKPFTYISARLQKRMGWAPGPRARNHSIL